MIEKLLAVSAFDKAKANLGSVGKSTGLGTISTNVDGGLYSTLTLLMNAILGIVGIVASIYIIYAGIKWLKAGGSEEDVKEAKQAIRSAVWGLLIIFSAYIIVNFVVAQLIIAVKK